MGDDLVYIYPEWLASSRITTPPPRKEGCSCRCSMKDEYGRPVFIGWCGPDCERRPR